MNMVAPTSDVLAYNKALASAWIEMQLSYDVSAAMLEYDSRPLGQLPARHPGLPAGAPLYPVDRMRWLESTTTAPTCLRRQSALSETASAMFRKYVSHGGRYSSTSTHLTDEDPDEPETSGDPDQDDVKYEGKETVATAIVRHDAPFRIGKKERVVYS